MLRIIQITDTHLLADKHCLLRGHNTDRSLRRVLDHAVQQVATIDFVLVTGDLAHDAEPSAYARLKSYLEGMAAPIECLPGNHDSLDIMQASLGPSEIGCANIIDAKRWRIIMLDSVIPGEDRGQLSDYELARLDKALMNLADGHALVCLHHPPVPVGNPSMDEMGLSNAREFFRIIDAYSHVRAILWGHAHSQFDDARRGVKLLGTPSTCFQFKASSSGIAIDNAPPAYRWLRLFADGTLETGVTAVPLSTAAVD
jgi:Icc protein